MFQAINISSVFENCKDFLTSLCNKGRADRGMGMPIHLLFLTAAARLISSHNKNFRKTFKYCQGGLNSQVTVPEDMANMYKTLV